MQDPEVFFGVMAVLVILAPLALHKLFNPRAQATAPVKSPSPDAGFGHFATEGLRQGLTNINEAVAGRTIAANDGLLHSYMDVDGIRWSWLWAQLGSNRPAGDLPSFGVRPYWIPNSQGEPVPLTTLAFCGVTARGRIAMDRDTPAELLTIMANDPDPYVQMLVQQRT